jgi:hypothetical protein
MPTRRDDRHAMSNNPVTRRYHDLDEDERIIPGAVLRDRRRAGLHKYNWRLIIRWTVNRPGRWWLMDPNGSEQTVGIITGSERAVLRRGDAAGWRFTGRITDIHQSYKNAPRRGKLWIMATEKSPDDPFQ